VPGTFEVSPATTSVKGILNYFPKGGVEFVFDPSTSRFIVGHPKAPAPGLASPHQRLAGFIDADNSSVVGGMFKRGNSGQILTNEHSGHYWQNWTPAVRQQFADFMESMGVNIIHNSGM
jgi:hypothetical protein